MRWQLALLAGVVLAVLVSGYVVFQKLPKPDFANRGVPEQCATIPDFSDYPSPPAYAGLITRVNWSSNPIAQEIEEEIMAATTSGVNFAGEYVLLSTACGDGCLSYTAIHAPTGNIGLHGLTANSPIVTRLDSRLVIVNPTPGPQRPTLYYDFNSALHYICETQG